MSNAGYIEPVKKVTVRVHPERSFSRVSIRPELSAPTCTEVYAEYL